MPEYANRDTTVFMGYLGEDQNRGAEERRGRVSQRLTPNFWLWAVAASPASLATLVQAAVTH